MNAVIEITSKLSTRRVPMMHFMQAAYTTVLEDQEIITAIHIPVMNDQARWGYYKFCRKVGEFADASCAAYFDPTSHVANLVVGALDGAPKSLTSLAQVVAQKGWPATSRETITEHVSDNLASLDTLNQKMLVTVISRCLDRAFNTKGSA
jgi:carbon-monoxide dehydrogenase medium subunit